MLKDKMNHIKELRYDIDECDLERNEWDQEREKIYSQNRQKGQKIIGLMNKKFRAEVESRKMQIVKDLDQLTIQNLPNLIEIQREDSSG